MLYLFGWFLNFLILKGVCRIKVFGKENIPKKGGFILASNHVSYLDPGIIGAAAFPPRKLNYMAKEELFVNPLFARMLFAVGAFPVKRDSADLSAIKEALRRVKSGEALVLFPEGSRRFDDGPGDPQGGIGFLAAKLQCPVIPAFIEGSDRALPRGANFIRPAQICVYFGKQISIERRMPYQEISRLIMENIRHLSCKAA